MTNATYAGTIIKLGLGSDTAPDIEFDGTTLETSDDADAATTGDQNTSVDYLDFLSGIPDIGTPIASFSLENLTVAGQATVFLNALVIQNFNGGSMSLYAPDNSLLLSGSLQMSTLSGPIGPPATGALFTTSFANVTGGTLAPQLKADSLTFSMSLTSINGGGGFAVLGAGQQGDLQPFSADVTLNVDAEQVPEPTTVLLAFLGGMLAASTRRIRLA